MRVVFELSGKKITNRTARVVKKLGDGEARSFHKEELPTEILEESSVGLRFGNTSFFILKNWEVHAVSKKIRGGLRDIDRFYEKLKLEGIVNKGPLRVLDVQLSKLATRSNMLIQAVVSFFAGGFILGLNDLLHRTIGTAIAIGLIMLFLFRDNIVVRWAIHEHNFKQT